MAILSLITRAAVASDGNNKAPHYEPVPEIVNAPNYHAALASLK